MHCIYTDSMSSGYSAIDRNASDAPIRDSNSDVTEYRKSKNAQIHYSSIDNQACIAG